MEEQILAQIKELRERLSHLERLEHAMAQNHGYIGGAWQKDPIGLGYSGPVRGTFADASLGTGTDSFDGDTVPAGEIWVIENIAINYTGTVTNVNIYAVLEVASTTYVLFEETGITSAKWYSRQGPWVLEAGDNIRWIGQNCTAGDDGGLQYVGRRVDVDL